MSTSYSTSANGYLNVGPLVFIPGVSNDLSSNTAVTSAANLVQNYPFIDEYYSIMNNMDYESTSITLADSSFNTQYVSANALPASTITGHSIGFDLPVVCPSFNFFSAAVSSQNASDNMLATCSYVQYIQSTWADFNAVNNIDMSGHSIVDLSFIAFTNGPVIEASGAILYFNDVSQINSENPSLSIVTGTNNGINMDPSSNVTLFNGVASSQNAKLDMHGLLAGNLTFNSLNVTFTGSNGSILFARNDNNGYLPSIAHLGVCDLSSAWLYGTGDVLGLVTITNSATTYCPTSFIYTFLLLNGSQKAVAFTSQNLPTNLAVNGNSSATVFTPQNMVLLNPGGLANVTLTFTGSNLVIDIRPLNGHGMGVDNQPPVS